MRIIQRDNKILLTPQNVDLYKAIYTTIIPNFKRESKDYFEVKMDPNAQVIDKMSKWSVMSTVVHKIDTSIKHFGL